MTRVFLAVTLATMLVGVLVLLIAQRRHRRAQVAAAPPTTAPTHGPLLTGSTGLLNARAIDHLAEEEHRRQLLEVVERFNDQIGVRFNDLYGHILSARPRIRPPFGDVDRTAWAWQVTMPHADGVETVLRCTMHEDCRQDANIGIACARDRVNQGRPPGHGR